MLPDRTTWQSTPLPKMMMIIVPKNSAAYSRMYDLRVHLGFMNAGCGVDLATYLNFAHLLGYRVTWSLITVPSDPSLSKVRSMCEVAFFSFSLWWKGTRALQDFDMATRQSNRRSVGREEGTR